MFFTLLQKVHFDNFILTGCGPSGGSAQLLGEAASGSEEPGKHHGQPSVGHARTPATGGQEACGQTPGHFPSAIVVGSSPFTGGDGARDQTG